MPRYVTLAEQKEYMAMGTQTDTDAALQMCIQAAEIGIDTYTRRQFVGTQGTLFVSRYDADKIRNRGFYLSSDLLALDQLVLGDATNVPVGSVWLEPRTGPPYRILRLKTPYTFVWNTDSDMIVVGTWGARLTPPRDIVHATFRWAAHLFRQRDATPVDAIGYTDVSGPQQQQRGMPDDVKWLLSPYRSRSGGVV